MTDHVLAIAWSLLIKRLAARGDKWAEEECKRLIEEARRLCAVEQLQADYQKGMGR